MEVQYLVELLESERDKNDEFRTEMRSRIGDLEQWAAVHEARIMERDTAATSRWTTVKWSVGTFLSLVGVTITLWTTFHGVK